jgi:hypothetical protein
MATQVETSQRPPGQQEPPASPPQRWLSHNSVFPAELGVPETYLFKKAILKRKVNYM